MLSYPFSLLIKPAGASCNMTCSYCFYLDNWKCQDQIPHMSYETIEYLLETYLALSLPMYAIGFQGGEPLLRGIDFYRHLVQKIQKKPIMWSLQTNATLIDEEWVRFFKEENFLIGISIDGNAHHNQYRTFDKNTSAHERIIQGVEFLKKHEVPYNVLSVVNNINVLEPILTYEEVKKHSNYVQFIPCVDTTNTLPYTINEEQWGEFLIPIFDYWLANDTKTISVRLFDSMISRLTGGMATTCDDCNHCNHYFMVEYDGSVYPCDFFGEPEYLLGNVMTHSWSEVQKSALNVHFGKNKRNFAEKCKNCPVLNACWGDCPKNRDPHTQLSLLCEGRKKFFMHAFPKLAQFLKNNPNFHCL